MAKVVLLKTNNSTGSTRYEFATGAPLVFVQNDYGWLTCPMPGAQDKEALGFVTHNNICHVVDANDERILSLRLEPLNLSGKEMKRFFAAVENISYLQKLLKKAEILGRHAHVEAIANRIRALESVQDLKEKVADAKKTPKKADSGDAASEATADATAADKAPSEAENGDSGDSDGAEMPDYGGWAEKDVPDEPKAAQKPKHKGGKPPKKTH